MATQTRSIGTIILPAGRTESPVLSIGKNSVFIKGSLDASQHLNPLVTVSISLEVSFDNGATWTVVANTSRAGGPAWGDGGVPVTDFTISTDINQSALTTRKMKLVCVCEGGSFTTSGGSIISSDTRL